MVMTKTPFILGNQYIIIINCLLKIEISDMILNIGKIVQQIVKAFIRANNLALINYAFQTVSIILAILSMLIDNRDDNKKLISPILEKMYVP